MISLSSIHLASNPLTNFNGLTEFDFNAAYDDLEELSGGYGLFYVLSNPSEFDSHTVQLAEFLDSFDCALQGS